MRDNLRNFLEVKNATNTSADLYFYGDIVSSWLGAWDDTDQYPDSVKNFLDEHKGKDLNIYVNSNGGSVFAGIAIYNMLKRHNGHKTVYIDGLAASISSVIALVGDEVVCPSNAYIMIHEPWSCVQGNSTEMRKAADLLDNIRETIINIYEENLNEGIDIEEVKEMVQAETWLNGVESVKYFKNVTLTDEVNMVACASELYDKYNKVPENILNKEVSEEVEEKINLDYYKAKLKMYEM